MRTGKSLDEIDAELQEVADMIAHNERECRKLEGNG